MDQVPNPSATEPLLPDELANERSSILQSNPDSASAGQESTAAGGNGSLALLGCTTLTLVLAGLAMVTLVTFLPMCAFLFSLPSSFTILIVAAVAQVIHLQLLWRIPGYLAVFRFLLLPIRRLMFPLVMCVTRIECIREGEPTLYYAIHRNGNPDDNNGNRLGFRKSIRRHYRRMYKIFRSRSNIRHVCVRSEKSLNLSHALPLVWKHQKRVCQDSDKNPVEEFIKRFLVVTVVPDAVLDLYYDGSDRLCSLQLSLQQADVYHWFMYFCETSACKSGIWWHGALLAMERSYQTPGIQYVNAQMHQEDSKLLAGYNSTVGSNSPSLSLLYPWSFAVPLAESATQVRLWD